MVAFIISFESRLEKNWTREIERVMDKEKESVGLVIESDNSRKTEGSLSPQIQEVLDSIDKLVKAKRMQQRGDDINIADEDITHKERADIIKMYCKLEEIRKKTQGALFDGIRQWFRDSCPRIS